MSIAFMLRKYFESIPTDISPRLRENRPGLVNQEKIYKPFKEQFGVGSAKFST
jgi:hypothetical protein